MSSDESTVPEHPLDTLTFRAGHVVRGFAPGTSKIPVPVFNPKKPSAPLFFPHVRIRAVLCLVLTTH